MSLPTLPGMSQGSAWALRQYCHLCGEYYDGYIHVCHREKSKYYCHVCRRWVYGFHSCIPRPYPGPNPIRDEWYCYTCDAWVRGHHYCPGPLRPLRFYCGDHGPRHLDYCSACGHTLNCTLGGHCPLCGALVGFSSPPKISSRPPIVNWLPPPRTFPTINSFSG